MSMGGSLGGGSSRSKQRDNVWNQQAPYLQGLYQRAYNSSLGLGTGGQAIAPGYGHKGGPGFVPPQNVIGDGIAPGQYGPDQYGRVQYGRSQAGGPGGLVGGGHPYMPNGAGQQYQAGGFQPGGDPLQQLGGNLTQQGQGMLGQLGMMGQSGNPFAQAQIGQLGLGLGRLFNQQIMPGIQSTFGQAGQLGGSRQALAQGQAAEGLGQAFTGGALDILGNSAQLALQANQAGLGGLGQVGNAGNMAQWGTLPGLAGLLGGPTILGSGSSKSWNANISGEVGLS